jgi:DNA-directed RNA polymerase subunit RPC12/RpoP/membrane protein YdbS with pleckstrin-like domain
VSAIRFQCAECRKTIEIGPDSSGLQIDCPSCGAPIVVPRSAAARVASPEPAEAIEREEVLYHARRAMFGDRPFAFAGSLLLIPLFGAGLIILLVWWLKASSVRLKITNRRTILEEGILSRSVSEVWHSDVRHLQVRQSPLQRLTNVGFIGISSAGEQGVEIAVDGFPRPRTVQRIIEECRGRFAEPPGAPRAVWPASHPSGGGG